MIVETDTDSFLTTTSGMTAKMLAIASLVGTSLGLLILAQSKPLHDEQSLLRVYIREKDLPALESVIGSLPEVLRKRPVETVIVDWSIGELKAEMPENIDLNAHVLRFAGPDDVKLIEDTFRNAGRSAVFPCATSSDGREVYVWE